MAPSPSILSQFGGGGGRDLRCAGREGGEGTPREGHDFWRLEEGAPAAFRGGAPAHAEGCERSGGGEGAFLRDPEPQPPAHPPPWDSPSEPRSRPPHLRAPAPRRTRGGDPGPRSRSFPSYLRPQVYTRGPQPQVPRRAGEGGQPLLPPAWALPSPGRLRSRRSRRCRCPLLQCESRCEAGPGPGRLGNRDSTWRGAARRRAHPLSGPLPRRGPAGADPPRSGGGWWLRRRGHPIRRPSARDSGCRGGREVRQPGGSGGGAAAWRLTSGLLPGSSPAPHPPKIWPRVGGGESPAS